jgi:S-adenosylmethionine synthetase
MRVLEKLYKRPIDEYKLEFVERKGLGHPDYIIDLSCESVSKALSRYYIDKFGMILHHNLDKGLLVGGSAEPKFGGGVVTQPIELIIAGRATTKIKGTDEKIPVEEIAIEAVKKTLTENYRFLDAQKHVSIETRIRPGSVDLSRLFGRKGDTPPANDTSFGVSYAPLTNAEKIALEIEGYLNSREYKRIYPYVGEDIKVMVLREKDTFNVTIAAAFIDRFFNNASEYLEAKEEVLDSILDYLSKKNFDIGKIKLMLNTADDPELGILYMTVTGTSAEAGDDGNTGRGNRINGLITPNRQMSMEAVAGKNPVSHVGKIYNVLALRISNRIYNETDGVREVYVKILSQIGAPINEPQAIHIQYILNPNTVEKKVKTKINRILDEEFTAERLHILTDEILSGKYTLF